MELSRQSPRGTHFEPAARGWSDGPTRSPWGMCRMPSGVLRRLPCPKCPRGLQGASRNQALPIPFHCARFFRALFSRALFLARLFRAFFCDFCARFFRAIFRALFRVLFPAFFAHFFRALSLLFFSNAFSARFLTLVFVFISFFHFPPLYIFSTQARKHGRRPGPQSALFACQNPETVLQTDRSAPDRWNCRGNRRAGPILGGRILSDMPSG